MKGRTYFVDYFFFCSHIKSLPKNIFNCGPNIIWSLRSLKYLKSVCVHMSTPQERIYAQAQPQIYGSDLWGKRPKPCRLPRYHIEPLFMYVQYMFSPPGGAATGRVQYRSSTLVKKFKKLKFKISFQFLSLNVYFISSQIWLNIYF